MANKIHFFKEDIDFKLSHKGKLRAWMDAIVKAHGMKLKEINFIFCSDAYLLEMNKKYLNHDTFTDVITFDHSEVKGKVLSDIYISWERVKDNANKFKVDTYMELYRVMIHGVLHLLGFDDKSLKNKEIMKNKEDESLLLLEF